MKLVITNPPVGIKPRLIGCFVNGKYYEYRHVTKRMIKSWKKSIILLKQSIVNTNKHINDIESGFDKYVITESDKQRKLEKLNNLNKIHERDLNILYNLIERSKQIDVSDIISHALYMMDSGIIDDDWGQNET